MTERRAFARTGEIKPPYREGQKSVQGRDGA